MAVRIRDLMRGTASIEFRSDVQVADYVTPANLDLLRHYIFTFKALDTKKSSVELLHTFCEAYSPGATDNRFAVIATYGHGKSHFALALANFFGKPTGSTEVQMVMEGIRHAIPGHDLGTLGYIEGFKEQHGRFLILILRGDEPNDLSTKFYRALKEELAYDGEMGADAQLPFWYTSAETFLTNIPDALHDKANSFLARYQLDLAALLGRVRDRQASTYDLCTGLFRELYRAAPQFEVGLSLKDAVRWLIENKCGAGGPYDGLLVLFDEFSTFVSSYTHSQIPGTPLQDLLNGIADARGKAAFIAFAQHDPDAVARQSSQGDHLANIQKELSRIPPARRYRLHSSLEEVLESYLRKNEQVWQELLRPDQAFARQLEEATTDALGAFQKRYLDDLKWDTVHFHHVVTIGGYPLHPLTTTALCSVELQVTASPRSVLGFVQDALKKMADEPVEREGAPNWAPAIGLVDYFDEMLGSDNWQRYRDALSGLSLPDEPDQAAVLKAMLLQSAAGISTAKLGYVKAIAKLSGLSNQRATETITSLAARGIVRRDPVTGNYSLPPLGWGRGGEKLVQGKAQRVSLDAATLDSLRADAVPLGLGPLQLSVPWGHSDDWFAEQVLVERARLKMEYLQGVTKRFTWSLDADVREKARGLVVLAIAESEADVQWYRDEVPGLLREAVGDRALPLVLVRPQTPSLALIERIKRYVALRDFTVQQKSQVGSDWHKAMRDQAEKEMRDALADFMRGCKPEAPSAFRVQLDKAGACDLGGVLTEVIPLSYSKGPRQWFTQYRATKAGFAAAVGTVCAMLMQGGKLDTAALVGKPVEKDLVDRYLKLNWHVLDTGNRVTPPPVDSPLSLGWQRLEDYFAPGASSKPARPVLEELLNAPFGYDWNTLGLLVAAWWSYRRYDLTAVGTGYPVSVSAGQKPRDLLLRIAGWSVRRINSEELRSEIQTLLIDVVSGRQRNQVDATRHIQKLKEFLTRGGEEMALKEKAKDALRRLEEGVQQADQYDSAAAQILQDLSRGKLQALLSCLSRIKELPVASLVAPTQLSPSQIRERVNESLEIEVNGLCDGYAGLKRIEDYTHNLTQLQLLGKQLKSDKLASLSLKVDDAVRKLNTAKAALEEEYRRQAVRREQEILIRNVSPQGAISELQVRLSQLEAMAPEPDVQAAWGAKCQSIKLELERLTTFAGSLDERVDQVIDRPSLVALQAEILRHQDRCDLGEAQAQVKAALHRCTLLDVYFVEAEGLRNRSRSRIDEFDRDIRATRTLVSNEDGYAIALQRQVAERLLADLEESVSSRRARAMQRLEACMQSMKAGSESPEQIERDLDRMAAEWTFLPEDAQQRLAALRQDIRDAIEKAKLEAKEKARVEAERRQQVALLHDIKTSGTISQLRQNLSRLTEMDPPPDLKLTWMQKRAAISKEIERLETLPTVLAARIGATADVRSIRKCREEVLSARALCDADTVHASLESLLAQCDVVEEYFRRVEQLRQHTRRDEGDFRADLAALQQLACENALHLSETQCQMAVLVSQTLQKDLANRCQTVVERLDSLERELEKKQSAAEIQRELEATDWTFLPADDRIRLEAIGREVQGRIDQNEVEQVEAHFRRIRDPQQQRACIEKLQRLVRAIE